MELIGSEEILSERMFMILISFEKRVFFEKFGIFLKIIEWFWILKM